MFQSSYADWYQADTCNKYKSTMKWNQYTFYYITSTLWLFIHIICIFIDTVWIYHFFVFFFYQIQPAYQSIKIEGALLLKKTVMKGIYTTWHKSKRNTIVKLLSKFFYKELFSSFDCSLNIAFLIKLHLALLVGVDSVHIFSRIFSLEYDTNSSFKRDTLALVVPYVS